MDFPKIDVCKALDELMESRIKIYPCYSNRASALGDDCERKLVYSRTHWEHAVKHEKDLEYIFQEGRNQEELMIRDLISAGFRITNQQQSFTWREHQITGSHDGLITDGVIDPIPFDIKSMSPFMWDSIDTSSLESAVNSLKKKPWTRKYLGQILLYCLMQNIEYGMIIFKNKSNGKPKQIIIPLFEFLDVAEELVLRADRINSHIIEGTIPECVEDTKYCKNCPFVTTCMPDRIEEAVTIVSDEYLEGLLFAAEELKPIAKKYNEIDEELKSAIKFKTMIVGSWFVSGKMVHKKGSDTPVPASSYWKSEIKRIVE